MLLLQWGARYAPAIAAGQWWRIFSSVVIHSSTVHVFSNALLWAVLANPLERTYGPVRILLIAVASGGFTETCRRAFWDMGVRAIWNGGLGGFKGC
jgi:rhomboid protease GluP